MVMAPEARGVMWVDTLSL